MDYVTITRRHRGRLLGGLLGTDCPYDNTSWSEMAPVDENGQVQVPVTLCAWCGTESPVTKFETAAMEWDERAKLRKKTTTGTSPTTPRP